MTIVTSAYGQRADLLNGNEPGFFLELLEVDSGRAFHVNVDEDQFKEFLSFIHLDSEEPAEEQQGVAPDEF